MEYYTEFIQYNTVVCSISSHNDVLTDAYGGRVLQQTKMIPPDISPYTLVYYEMRTAGFISSHGRPWSLIYSITQIILINAFGTFAILDVILGKNDITGIILALSAVAVYIHVHVKLLVMMSNENKILKLLDRLEKYRTELLNDAKYRNYIVEADQTCKKYFKYFNTFFISFPIISFISNYYADYSTNFEQPHLTHKLWIPWNMNEFWPYSAGTFFVLVMTLSTIIIYSSCGVFLITFTFQLSAYLKVLQNRLETKGAADKTIYQHHKLIKQFLQDYSKIFTGQLFVEIMVASLEPCGFGYAIIKGFKRNEPAALFIYYGLIICLLAPFSVCYCGQEISTQMERIHESSYMSNWYEEKPKVRRDLYTMMLVTVRPMTLNYKFFITFNFECFASIIQGVYSYLMMISSFETAD